MSRPLTVILLVATLVAMVLYGGLVMSWLWLWFVVPLGVRPIGVAEAIGLSVIWSSLTHRLAVKNDDREVVDVVVVVACAETFFLVLGLVVHQFT